MARAYTVHQGSRPTIKLSECSSRKRQPRMLSVDSSRPIKLRSVGKRDRMYMIKLTISTPMIVTLAALVNYSKILLLPQELARACRM